MKCGDKVIDMDNGCNDRVRIFVAEYEGRYLLIHGGDEETDAFYSKGGAPLTYWAETIMPVPTLDIGIIVQDVKDLNRVINCNEVVTHAYRDSNGNMCLVNFMRKDELEQRGR